MIFVDKLRRLAIRLILVQDGSIGGLVAGKLVAEQQRLIQCALLNVMLELDAVHDRVDDAFFAYFFYDQILRELGSVRRLLLLLLAARLGKLLGYDVAYLRLNVDL